MATAADLIATSLRLLGALAEGETAGGNLSADCLSALNTMLDSWSAERLSVFATQDQTFTWTANSASRTLGPTGDFVGTRPVLVDDATYFKVNGVSYGLQQINDEQYSNIALKTSTSTFPQVMWVNMDMPNITMYVYPVPTSALEMHIVSVEALAQPALITTTLSYPPGYERALQYNLACELAPQFGVEPSPRVQRIADVSKRTLKRVNNPMDVMSMPAGLLPMRPRFNIYAGNS